MSSISVDLSYYAPINKQQEEFHRSTATHKLLMGGYGGGKTYPAVHEAAFHCLDNPGHTFLLTQNTWDTLEDRLVADALKIFGKANLIQNHNKTRKEIDLVNGTKVIYRPLTLGWPNFKGLHLCGFLVDDPDMTKYTDLISSLWSRLRDPPYVQAKRFQTIITSNWEGRNWIWKTYMQDREPGGDNKFAYWICPTTDNPTLHKDYISDLAAMHSEEWMQRYVHCSMESHIGLVYPEFDPKIHHFDSTILKDRKDLIHIMAIDMGMVHPTSIHKLCTDGKKIFVYDEWHKKGQKLSQVGGYLQNEVRKQHFRYLLIDPSANRGEQTSSTNIKKELRTNFGLSLKDADNTKLPGIRIIKDLLRPAIGEPRLLIDCIKCPELAKGMRTYRWREPRNMDYDDMTYVEEPVKKDDDAVDSLRYGTNTLIKFIRGYVGGDLVEMQKEQYRQERMEKLKFYNKSPRQGRVAKMKRLYKRIGVPSKYSKSLLLKIK